MYREPTTLQPVEYYNNLPYYRPSVAREEGGEEEEGKKVPEVAVILDPVVATGGTASAAIQTLLEWGVGRVVLCAILGCREGVERAAGVVGEGGIGKVRLGFSSFFFSVDCGNVWW